MERVETLQEGMCREGGRQDVSMYTRVCAHTRTD